MGREAITRTTAGELAVPTPDAEWDRWVSASRTRNHVLDAPLLDWLERHGEARGTSATVRTRSIRAPTS